MRFINMNKNVFKNLFRSIGARISYGHASKVLAATDEPQTLSARTSTNRRWCRWSGAAVALAAVMTLAAINAQPANAKFEGVTIAPASNSIQLHNNQLYTGQITATNTAKTAKTIEMSAGYYSIIGDNYDTPNYEKASKFSTMKEWIKVWPEKAVIQPGQSQTITYTIAVPNNPPSGTQYATIFVATQPDKYATNGITAISRVGMVIDAYMLDGKTLDKTNIQDEKIDSYQQSGPLKGSFQIKNEGNLGTKVNYSLKVTSALNGQEVYKGKTEKSTVYPETTRGFVAEWKEMGVGLYNVEMDIEVNGRSHTVKQIVCTVPIWIFILVAIGILSLIAYGVSNYKMAKKAKGNK